jgi:hypothetical protein
MLFGRILMFWGLLCAQGETTKYKVKVKNFADTSDLMLASHASYDYHHTLVVAVNPWHREASKTVVLHVDSITGAVKSANPCCGFDVAASCHGAALFKSTFMNTDSVMNDQAAHRPCPVPNTAKQAFGVWACTCVSEGISAIVPGC